MRLTTLATIPKNLTRWVLLTGVLSFISGCSSDNQQSIATQAVQLTHGIDETAGGVSSYIITTTNATYYLEKEGGGLSSMLDKEGVDWIGFHNEKGSGHKGEYRGFPNAIHKQDGNYFHALNAGTDLSTSVIDIDTKQHVRITFTSANKKWEGQWDFYPDRLDFTMSKVSAGYKYWVQYEGVPFGEMDDTDFWFSANNNKKNLINDPFLGDLPSPEWIAFGDEKSSRMLYLLHHEDDEYPDNYVSRPDMTVFGFGRSNKDKYLQTPQTFSLGFVESVNYEKIKTVIEKVIQ
ncbi:hypothetical protein Q4530_13950 [Colwellia sp. 1_MG-2023]|uniref:hypothetical protein n=1 Tax=unclassified Colwellia TaxID=196834 RepID=UPI00209097F0|nr:MULTISPECIES: hypothetical protein [unclassified Colwellia]MDO6653676.1 hypothetical protein [Colwellia sp. 3_MG-2023]MDO6666487.1 hypothetical protein [Colwellia sp. 2_MG-2023]MDO6690878.1 hypothetical protein [Colwellia sp. 1_MG-2023]